MSPKELKNAIKAKTAQLDEAMELGKPKSELMQIYKELKELHFQRTQSNLLSDNPEDLMWHPVTGKASKP